MSRNATDRFVMGLLRSCADAVMVQLRNLSRRLRPHTDAELVLPKAAIDQSVATLPGLDGRKMSKSYARAAGETEQRLYALAAWHETHSTRIGSVPRSPGRTR